MRWPGVASATQEPEVQLRSVTHSSSSLSMQCFGNSESQQQSHLGIMPDHISQFGSLKVLDFSENHVEGKIPESVGSLTNHQVLNLGRNLLSGTCLREENEREIEPGRELGERWKRQRQSEQRREKERVN